MSFQVIKTWKQSNDPDFEAKKNRVLALYDIAEGKAGPGEGDPSVIICMDEFGPLNLLPRPGKQWAPAATRTTKATGDAPRRRRRRATYTRNDGVRHLLAAYDLGKDKIYSHIKTTKNRTKFLEVLPLPALALPARDRIRIARASDPGATSTLAGALVRRAMRVCCQT